MHVKLYALVDPRTSLVMYIGKTCDRLSVRLTMHLCQGSKAIMTWGRELASLGQRPKIFLIDEVPLNEWRQRERDLIEVFPSLLNKYSGGGGAAFRWAPTRSEYDTQRGRDKRDEERLVPLDTWVATLGEDGEDIINGQYYDRAMEWGRYSDSQ